MARLITLTFSFEQKQYEAEIMVDDASETNWISVYVPDRSLHYIIPEGKTRLCVDKEIKAPSENAPDTEQLKYSILNAYIEHENQSPPVNMW